MWLRLMLIAFLMNGGGTFGLRILVGMNAGEYKWHYIALWYWAGFILMAVYYFRRERLPHSREVYVSSVMGVCSVTGTLGLAFALDYGVPGFIVYPVSVGGGLFMVVLAGMLFFKERVSAWGILGILLGICALVVLTLS